MRKKLLLIAALLFTSSVTFADVSTPELTIKKIQTAWNTSGVYFETVENQIFEGCSKAQFYLNPNDSMFDQDFSLLLSALHTKSRVILRISGCSGNDMKVIGVAVINE